MINGESQSERGREPDRIFECENFSKCGRVAVTGSRFGERQIVAQLVQEYSNFSHTLRMHRVHHENSFNHPSTFSFTKDGWHTKGHIYGTQTDD